MNIKSATLVFVLTLGVNIQMIFGQEGNLISIPSTPAFSILDYEPASVLRPSNPKDLSADILNSIGQDGKLQMNLGLEVAPYWLQSHPQLTANNYLNATGWQLLKQSLMLSAATVQDSSSGKNKFGAGFRFKLSQGDITPLFTAKRLELQQRSLIIAAVNGALPMVPHFASKADLIEHLKTTVDTLALSTDNRMMFIEVLENLSPAYIDLRALIMAISNEIAQRNLSLQREVIAEGKKRVGWIAEVAGAASFITTSADEFEKAGLWLNVSHVVSKTDALAFSVRSFFTSKDSVTTNIDIGGSYIKEVENFSVSIELLGRYYSAKFADINIDSEEITRIEEDFTYRFAVQGAYKIGKDISVNLSLGKDFDKPFAGPTGFFSIFGVNYSIFKNAGTP